MQEFLLILKGDGLNHLSPDELQQIMIDYRQWVDALGERYLAGQRLEESGQNIARDGSVVTDGPFLAAKEIIAGYMLITADSLEEATRVAQSLPHVGLYDIEIRPIAYPKMK